MPVTELQLQIGQACAKRLDTDLAGLGLTVRATAPRNPGAIARREAGPLPGVGQRERLERRPVRRPIPSLADRLLQILVRQPQRAADLQPEVMAMLSSEQQTLVDWVRGQSGRSFAALHEAALAAAGPLGPQAGQASQMAQDSHPAALFQRYARPEVTLDELLASEQTEAISLEWDRSVTGLLLRGLQARASSLAKSLEDPTGLGSGQSQRLAELRDLQAQIAELKQSLMQQV
jgi:hypothetical protein